MLAKHGFGGLLQVPFDNASVDPQTEFFLGFPWRGILVFAHADLISGIQGLTLTSMFRVELFSNAHPQRGCMDSMTGSPEGGSKRANNHIFNHTGGNAK
jgi:hypothetical protein